MTLHICTWISTFLHVGLNVKSAYKRGCTGTGKFLFLRFGVCPTKTHYQNGGQNKPRSVHVTFPLYACLTCGISGPSTYRLYCESVKIRDLDGRGPWAVASERSEDATKGPRLSKSRIFIGRAV